MKAYGLFHENLLLGVALFGNPRTRAKQMDYTTELLRLAFHKEWRIKGGGSKLIKHFLTTAPPVNLFTYQDTTGEASNIYGAAGLTLKAAAKKKQYVVAPGKTLETALRGEYFSIGEVSRRGPDALVGSNLGEVFRRDGTRKTNPELFIEELGWHVETTSGDRVWEWHNPNWGFYVYKITSTVDEGYYFGKHQYKKKASSTDPLADGYWASGGKKYQEWVSRVGKENLQKTILKEFPTFGMMNRYEKKLLGDLYREDPNCKNTLPGGTGTSMSFPILHIKLCPLHGNSKHTVRGTCLKCSASKFIVKRLCSAHGETSHTGDTCLRCIQEKLVEEKNCSTHGLTIHRGGHCAKCLLEKAITVQTCPHHGEVKFLGSTCYLCKNQKLISRGNCSIHGETIFKKDKCMKCSTAKRIKIKYCPKHGETKFTGNTCSKCVNEELIKMRLCPIHGKTKHANDKCYKCIAAANDVLKICPVHGEVLHRKTTCLSCKEAKAAGFAYCETHGEVPHYRNKCLKCHARVGVMTLQVCEFHGESMFKHSNCQRCEKAS